MKAIVSVLGRDRIGIVAEVSQRLSEEKISIINISQQLLDGNFTMIIVVDIPEDGKDLATLAEEFAAFGKSRELAIRLQHDALFQTMHRI